MDADTRKFWVAAGIAAILIIATGAWPVWRAEPFWAVIFGGLIFVGLIKITVVDSTVWLATELKAGLGRVEERRRLRQEAAALSHEMSRLPHQPGGLEGKQC